MTKKYTLEEAGRKGGLATAKRHPDHHSKAAKIMWKKMKSKKMTDEKTMRDEEKTA